MKKYGMFLKNGKDLITSTKQETLKQAINHFASLKQLSTENFKKLFIVSEIKNGI